MPGQPRILLVRTDRLGDVILTLPMLPLLRRAYPDGFLGVLLNRYTGGIVKGNPFADLLLWYDGENGEVPFGPMLRAVREQRFDAVVLVHPTPRLAWLMFRAGIPVRIGTGYRWYSLLFNRRVFEHRRDAKRHELEYNLQLLKELQCPVPDQIHPEFGIVVPQEAAERLGAVLRAQKIDPGVKPVVVHPGSGGSAKEWPPEYFGELIRKVARRHVVVVTGTAEEADTIQTVLRGGGATSLAGKLDLMELAALLQNASVFVSHSTGPIHLAAALGTPVVGLYPQHPAMSERRWGPYTTRKRVFVPAKPQDCEECRKGPGEPCACMASIGVEEVAEAVLQLAAGQGLRTTRRVIHES